MKDMLKAAAAMAVIILVQVVLSYAFTYHVGEVFTRVSFIILFYHYAFKRNNDKLKAVK